MKSLCVKVKSSVTGPISPSKICNLKGVTRYYSKLIAKLQNEYLPVRNVDACQARAVREMRNLN